MLPLPGWRKYGVGEIWVRGVYAKGETEKWAKHHLLCLDDPELDLK